MDLAALLTEETADLATKGYEITLMGDFNAHINPSIRFQFENYPHPPNNNGVLLEQFVENTNLYNITTEHWNGSKSKPYTFQKDLGTRYL